MLRGPDSLMVTRRGHGLRRAEILFVRFGPIIGDFLSRFSQRDLLCAKELVQIIFEPVLQMRVPRLCDVTFRPKVSHVISSAQLA